uniref:Major sperm protein n=1 Tax=Pristionchus pacificus TaxID=54126 RepID=A0A2A6CAZ5_PRIPA|eukprot:PDM75213.1 MSP domain-containing protein [Pristionchus pacificus]
MAQSVPPGDIATQPGTKIVFNAPYDDKHTYHIKVTNSSARRIGWAFKTTNMKRLGVDPSAGVLDPKENALIAVSCDAFAYGQEDTNNDRVTIEWTNTPDGAAKQFRREWFQGDGMGYQPGGGAQPNVMYVHQQPQVVVVDDCHHHHHEEDAARCLLWFLPHLLLILVTLYALKRERPRFMWPIIIFAATQLFIWCLVSAFSFLLAIISTDTFLGLFGQGHHDDLFLKIFVVIIVKSLILILAAFLFWRFTVFRTTRIYLEKKMDGEAAPSTEEPTPLEKLMTPV